MNSGSGFLDQGVNLFNAETTLVQAQKCNRF